MKLLITSGATREPIDGVRFISNASTGRTGAALADFFTEAGFEVTYVRGEGAAEPARCREILGFTDFGDLDRALKYELGREAYFAVIHLAAVSDYSVSAVQVGGRSFKPGELAKIDSGEELGLVLKRNFKIVDFLKDYAKSYAMKAPGALPPLVVAFKLTHAADPETARQAAGKVAGVPGKANGASSGAVDAVVHNDLAQISKTRQDGSAAHQFRFFQVRGGELVERKSCSGAGELGAAILGWFRQERGDS